MLHKNELIIIICSGIFLIVALTGLLIFTNDMYITEMVDAVPLQKESESADSELIVENGSVQIIEIENLIKESLPDADAIGNNEEKTIDEPAFLNDEVDYTEDTLVEETELDAIEVRVTEETVAEEEEETVVEEEEEAVAEEEDNTAVEEAEETAAERAEEKAAEETEEKAAEEAEETEETAANEAEETDGIVIQESLVEESDRITVEETLANETGTLIETSETKEEPALTDREIDDVLQLLSELDMGEEEIPADHNSKDLDDIVADSSDTMLINDIDQITESSVQEDGVAELVNSLGFKRLNGMMTTSTKDSYLVYHVSGDYAIVTFSKSLYTGIGEIYVDNRFLKSVNTITDIDEANQFKTLRVELSGKGIVELKIVSDIGFGQELTVQSVVIHD